MTKPKQSFLHRSRAREIAMQLLYQIDQNPKPIRRAIVEDFARNRALAETRVVTLALELFDGVRAKVTDIDPLIVKIAENWRLHRMLPVDRNVLRLAIYEMRFAPTPTPAAVAINEAIELSRRFGSLDSPGFVNGILDKAAKLEIPAATKPTVGE
ncbi:MAG: transcription antitermination factor NusB [Gemmataceae bacterium]